MQTLLDKIIESDPVNEPPLLSSLLSMSNSQDPNCWLVSDNCRNFRPAPFCYFSQLESFGESLLEVSR
jgi:hypothetical protein